MLARHATIAGPRSLHNTGGTASAYTRKSLPRFRPMTWRCVANACLSSSVDLSVGAGRNVGLPSFRKTTRKSAWLEGASASPPAYRASTSADEQYWWSLTWSCNGASAVDEERWGGGLPRGRHSDSLICSSFGTNSCAWKHLPACGLVSVGRPALTISGKRPPALRACSATASLAHTRIDTICSLRMRCACAPCTRNSWSGASGRGPCRSTSSKLGSLTSGIDSRFAAPPRPRLGAIRPRRTSAHKGGAHKSQKTHSCQNTHARTHKDVSP